MTYVYDTLAPVVGIGNALALLLVAIFLALGPFKKFWIVFFYAAWEFVATVALTVADIFLRGSAQQGATQTAANRMYARLYWTNDVIVDLFRFILVIVLIYRVAQASKTGLANKKVLARVLTGVVVAMIVLPFLLFHTEFRPWPHGVWFNSTSQLLNFGAAIMNLMLWGSVVASKQRDPQLLTVSAGLGVVVTGTAISYGFRHFLSEGAGAAASNLFLNLVQLTGWSIWCLAFRPARRRREAPDNALPSR